MSQNAYSFYGNRHINCSEHGLSNPLQQDVADDMTFSPNKKFSVSLYRHSVLAL